MGGGGGGVRGSKRGVKGCKRGGKGLQMLYDGRLDLEQRLDSVLGLELLQHEGGEGGEVDRDEVVAAVLSLSKAKLRRVSSRPVWGLLVRGSSPVWLTANLVNCCSSSSGVSSRSRFLSTAPNSAAMSVPD